MKNHHLGSPISAERTSSVSLIAVVIGCSLVLYSWGLFILLPGSMFVLASLPFWFLLVWLLSWVAGPERRRFPVSGRQKRLFWSLVLFLVVLAPVYSYYYGYYHVTRMFNELGIEAREVKRNVELLDRFGDVGQERGFGVIYEVHDPLDETTAKTRQQLENKEDWLVGGPNPLDLYPVLVAAECILPRYFGKVNTSNFEVTHTSIVLFESGRLGTGFVYEQPRSCTDIR